MAGDDVQRALGRLEASDESSQRQREELFKQIGELREDMHTGFTEMRAMMAPLASMPTHIKSHCDDLRVLNNYVQRIKGVMWSGRVAWIALIALFGAGWTIYGEVQSRFAKADERHNVIWSAITRMSPK